MMRHKYPISFFHIWINSYFISFIGDSLFHWPSIQFPSDALSICLKSAGSRFSTLLHWSIFYYWPVLCCFKYYIVKIKFDILKVASLILEGYFFRYLPLLINFSISLWNSLDRRCKNFAGFSLYIGIGSLYLYIIEKKSLYKIYFSPWMNICLFFKALQ